MALEHWKNWTKSSIKILTYFYFVSEVVLRSETSVKAEIKLKSFQTLKIIFSKGQMEKILGHRISETRKY